MSKLVEHKFNNSKPEINTLCKSFYGNELKKKGFNVIGLYMCRYGDSCREAHSWDQIKRKLYIDEWEKMDKTHISLYGISQNIINTITQSGDSINNTKYKHQISKLNKMTFVELLQFCYDIICFHRKIAKNLPSKKSKGSETPGIGEGGYRYKEDVPQFWLENEDIFWALERTLHDCPTHTNMIMNRTVCRSTSTLCTGHINCKLGEHEPSKVACCDDLLYGKCSCVAASKFIDEKKRIESELLELKKQLTSSLDSDGFQVKLSKKTQQDISDKIKNLSEDYAKIPVRKVHYTEQGMVPMSIHLAAVAEVKAKEIDITKLELAPVKRLVKKSYD